MFWYLPHLCDDLFAWPLPGLFDTERLGSQVLIYEYSCFLSQLPMALVVIRALELRDQPLQVGLVIVFLSVRVRLGYTWGSE